jgi:hypothetical protein
LWSSNIPTKLPTPQPLSVNPSPQIAPLSPLFLPKLSPLIGCCLSWVAQRLHSAVAGHPDCCPIVVVQSLSYDCAAAIVVSTIVALLLVITIVSSLSSASHCAIASCLLSCPSIASSPPAGCCIASAHATASHLPGASASHRAVTSCHAPLAPLVQLIVALPLHMPSPPIVPIVISAVIAVIGGGRESSPSPPMTALASSSIIVIVQLIVTFPGAIVSSIVILAVTATALGVSIIILITSGAA